MVDGNNHAKILHYGSRNYRRVTRIVMAAELLALVSGFDQAFVVNKLMDELLGTALPLDAYIHSRTTFNCVAMFSSTLEKRLQIDVAALHESYIRG